MGGVQRLADRAAKIGLQGMAEAVVVVAVRGERGLDLIGPAAEEVELEKPLLEHSRGQPDEALGTRQRGEEGLTLSAMARP